VVTITPYSRAVASIVRRYPMPVVFVVAFCVVSAVYSGALDPAERQALVAATATNIANLKTDPFGTLVASAFVAEGAQWAWAVLAAVGLFPLAHRFGNLRALLVAACAHVAGTLLSEGLLAWRISTGALPASMRFLDDVGPSYVIASALVVTVVYGPEPVRHWHRGWLVGSKTGRWWRAVAAVGLAFLAPSLFSGLGHLDVAAVGHVVSMTTGLAVGWIHVRSERRRDAVSPPAEPVLSDS
jgi:hypothetical protein